MTEKTNLFPNLIRFRETNRLKMAIAASIMLWCATPQQAAADTYEKHEIASVQQQKVKTTGTVLDQNGEAMIGVSVKVKDNATMGTITDLEGKFSIDAPKGATLEISYIGYKTVTVKAEGTALHITMKEDAEVLDEVVIVGYGSQKKVNVTGAVGMVNSEVLEARPVQNVSQALQGVVPGLNLSVGNSGGALLNLNGELIGINTAILAPGGGSVGIGFAIPSNMARTLAQQLIDFGEIKRGLLGIKGTEMSADIAKAFNLDVQRGAFVSEVLPGSGSAKAGVKAGDIITSLNGKPLNSFAELRSRIATTEPGTKVKLGLLRNGKPLEVEVTLDTSTSSSASAEMITPALEGATLSDGQLKDGGKGIKIDEVVKGSPAAQAGLQKDDVIIGVNRDRVNSIAEMRKVLAAKPAIIALQIVRGNESIYLLMR